MQTCVDKYIMIDIFFINQSYGSKIYKINNQNILRILKNGTTSLEQYCRTNSCEITTVRDDFNPDQDYYVDVYFRNPIERYFSAKETVKNMYKFSNSSLPPMLDEDEDVEDLTPRGFFLDSHFYPQYWSLLWAYVESYCSNRVFFRLHPFEDIDKVLNGLNLNKNNIQDHGGAINRKILKEKYIYDLEIYNHLLGKTLNYEELWDFLSFSEKTHPRIGNFIRLTNPRHHNLKTEEKINLYKNALDDITKIANKAKKI